MRHDGAVTNSAASAPGPSPKKPRPSTKSAARATDSDRPRPLDAVEIRTDVPAAMEALSQAGFDASVSNDSSMRSHAELLRQQSSALEERLRDPNISAEERESLMAQMSDIRNMSGAKDTENKQFNLTLAEGQRKAAVIGLGVVSVAVAGVLAGPEGVKQLTKALPQVARRAIES